MEAKSATEWKSNALTLRSPHMNFSHDMLKSLCKFYKLRIVKGNTYDETYNNMYLALKNHEPASQFVNQAMTFGNKLGKPQDVYARAYIAKALEIPFDKLSQVPSYEALYLLNQIKHNMIVDTFVCDIDLLNHVSLRDLRLIFKSLGTPMVDHLNLGDFYKIVENGSLYPLPFNIQEYRDQSVRWGKLTSLQRTIYFKIAQLDREDLEHEDFEYNFIVRGINENIQSCIERIDHTQPDILQQIVEEYGMITHPFLTLTDYLIHEIPFNVAVIEGKDRSPIEWNSDSLFKHSDREICAAVPAIFGYRTRHEIIQYAIDLQTGRNKHFFVPLQHKPEAIINRHFTQNPKVKTCDYKDITIGYGHINSYHAFTLSEIATSFNPSTKSQIIKLPIGNGHIILDDKHLEDLTTLIYILLRDSNFPQCASIFDFIEFNIQCISIGQIYGFDSYQSKLYIAYRRLNIQDRDIIIRSLGYIFDIGNLYRGLNSDIDHYKYTNVYNELDDGQIRVINTKILYTACICQDSMQSLSAIAQTFFNELKLFVIDDNDMSTLGELPMSSILNPILSGDIQANINNSWSMIISSFQYATILASLNQTPTSMFNFNPEELDC